MRFSIFKQHKNKTFNYTPRFYDERKERLNNLKKKYGVDENEEANKTEKKSHTRVSFRDEWKQQRKERVNRNSRIRFLVILLILFTIAFAVLRNFNFSFLNG
jgi:cytochrome c-type biogenesis protein CcmH/NrfG